MKNRSQTLSAFFLRDCPVDLNAPGARARWPLSLYLWLSSLREGCYFMLRFVGHGLDPVCLFSENVWQCSVQTAVTMSKDLMERKLQIYVAVSAPWK